MSNDASEKETKTFVVGIDIFVSGYTRKTMYLHVTGVPKDLPKEYDNTVLIAAKQQFTSLIQTLRFLEVYDYGKKPIESHPMFINISNSSKIEILNAQIMED